MQYEHQNFYHTHFSVLPPAFPEPSPRAQLRSERALKGHVWQEQILRMGGGRMWSYEGNKIGKILRKIEVIDLIRIEIVASEK